MMGGKTEYFHSLPGMMRGMATALGIEIGTGGSGGQSERGQMRDLDRARHG